MGYKVKNARVAPQPKSSRARMPIWERGIADITDNLDLSIAEATGRYHTEGGAAAPNNPIKDTKDNPRTQAFASKNWRVSKKRANPSKEASLDNEVCIISIKAGGTKLPVLEDNKGNTVTDVEVNSVNLVEELHDLRAWIQDLKEAPKTRKDKKELHETLKAAYKPKKDASKYSYNADSDKWLAK